MGELIKNLNAGLAFLLELVMLVVYGYHCFVYLESPVWRWLLGIGIPLILIIVWGLWLAPRATRRLTLIPGLIVSTALFVSAAALLFIEQALVLALVLLGLIILNRVLLVVFKQW